MATNLPFEDDILKLLFHGTAITGIAQNQTTTPYTAYFVSLMAEDPSTLNVPSQLSKEVVYINYARQSVPRTSAAWTVQAGMVSPVGIISFPAASGVVTPILATYFGLGTLVSGAGVLMALGKLVPPIQIVDGTVPRIDNNPPASRIPSDWV